MVQEKFLISEAAKRVEVESHVLRYWEVELELPIKRNEQGHRYYTEEDIECFMRIKEWKEKGLQLKAIKTIIFDHKRDIIVPVNEGKEEKVIRLQMLMRQFISEAVMDCNEEMVSRLKETISKEMDYQFRLKGEEDSKREEEWILREEEHYRKIDELLRGTTQKKRKRKKHPFF